MFTLLAAGSACALEIDTGNPDLSIRFDNTVRLNYGVRVEAVNPKISGNPNFDDGEVRFQRHDAVVSRVDWLPELDVVYKRKTGLRLSGNAWYDGAYDNRARTSSGNFNSFQDLGAVSNGALTGFAPVSVPFSRLGSYVNNEYSDRVRRFYRRGTDLLDAFVFTRFEAGESDIALKLGQHAVYWGESLFFPFHGIAYSQGPFNGQKAAVTPGIEAKEVALPSPQLSLNMSVTPALSLMAQYYFRWRPNRLPEGGTYAGSGDGLFDGPDRQWIGLIVPKSLSGAPVDMPMFLDRVKGQDHGDSGNFGIGMKYAAKSVSESATFGAYFRQFNETQPYRIFQAMPSGAAPKPEPDGAGLSAGTYRMAYADKTRMAAISYTDNIGGVSVAGDLSYRRHTALANSGIAADGSGPRGNMLFATVNGLLLLPPSPMWSTATLITELAYARLLSVTHNPALFYGEGYAGCPTNDKKDGCATKDALGVAISFTPQWVEALPSVNLGLPIFVSYGLSGNNAGLGGGYERSARYSIGLEADVRQRYYLSLKYNDSYDRPQPVNALGFHSSGSGTYMQNNRGWVSLTFKTSF
jgi:hypothetical protein